MILDSLLTYVIVGDNGCSRNMAMAEKGSRLEIELMETLLEMEIGHWMERWRWKMRWKMRWRWKMEMEMEMEMEIEMEMEMEVNAVVYLLYKQL